MTEDLKQYEQRIKSIHSFKWKPRYEETFHTEWDVNTIFSLAIKTFEKLEWTLVYRDQKSVVACRIWNRNRETEKIEITYENAVVNVKSISLQDEFWDRGINSRRVKLFIYVFQETEKEYDKEVLKQLGADYEKELNWDEYEIPEELPKPEERMTSNFPIILTSGIAITPFLGYLMAYLIVEGVYWGILFETGVILVISLIFKWLIKFMNYVNFNTLKFLLAGIIIIVYFFAGYFEYEIVTDRWGLYATGFTDYLKLKVHARLPVEYLNSSLIELILVRIVQIAGVCYGCYIFLVINLTSYVRKRVPMEVVEFGYYHFLKGKTEKEVRMELEKKGWKSRQSQDEVFETIRMLQSLNESNKM